tara:strand:- start:26 stop:232 length:207 start_codon:yes stop_codon:yes gene_type:complete
VNTLKKNKGGKLTVSNKKVEVAPPKGYHWMEDRGRYFLMQGEYAEHPGAVDKAEFKTATHAEKNKPNK